MATSFSINNHYWIKLPEMTFLSKTPNYALAIYYRKGIQVSLNYVAKDVCFFANAKSPAENFFKELLSQSKAVEFLSRALSQYAHKNTTIFVRRAERPFCMKVPKDHGL